MLGSSRLSLTLAPGHPQPVVSKGTCTHVHRGTHIGIIKNKINLLRENNPPKIIFPQGRGGLGTNHLNELEKELAISVQLYNQKKTSMHRLTRGDLHNLVLYPSPVIAEAIKA